MSTSMRSTGRSIGVDQPTMRDGRAEAWRPSEYWQRGSHRAAKRIVDVGAASIALVILAPMLLVVAAAIRLSSPGPVLFRQTRLGRDGIPFDIYKLRTMFVDNDAAMHRAYYTDLVRGIAEPIEGSFKLRHDPRVTPLGRILRQLSIDELPQLFNVMQGDMSLVGPRPPLPYEAQLYDDRAHRRLAVVPGITGSWQVGGRNTLDFQQMIALDLDYIENWSFWLDLSILIRTPRAVISAQGAH